MLVSLQSLDQLSVFVVGCAHALYNSENY
jgi:hypothetical protein